MKKRLVITVLAALFGGVAYANAPKHDNPCAMGKVLTEGVELSADQQALVDELKEQRREGREDRHEMHREMMKQRAELLKGYAEGTLSRDDVQAQMTVKHAQMAARHAESKEILEALIDSYTPVQKDQVRANVAEKRACREEHQAALDERQAKMEGHMAHRAGKRAELLTVDLNLSAEQQSLFDAWQEGQLEMMAEKMERHSERDGKHLEALLDSEQDADAVQGKKGKRGKHEDDSQQHIVEMQAQAGLMMDFVDSLNLAQRNQLVQNLAEMRAKMESHHGRKKDHGKDHSKEKERR